MFRVSQYMRELAQAEATGEYPTSRRSSRSIPGKGMGPVVFWHLIRRCNLTCKHCYALYMKSVKTCCSSERPGQPQPGKKK